MTKFAIIIEPRAEQELQDAVAWISQHNPGAALAWYQGCRLAIRGLRVMPERCPLAPENKMFARGIRQLLYRQYRILFTIEGETVHVLHVRHGARDYLRPE